MSKAPLIGGRTSPYSSNGTSVYYHGHQWRPPTLKFKAPIEEMERRSMAAARLPSLCGMEERDAAGRGTLESRPAQQPWLGGQLGEEGAGLCVPRAQNPPLSQLPISITTSHGSASCRIVCHQKQGPSWLPVSSCCPDFGRASWDSSSAVGQGFSGPVLTNPLLNTHTHTQSTCAGMTQLAHGKQVGLKICELFLRGPQG